MKTLELANKYKSIKTPMAYMAIVCHVLSFIIYIMAMQAATDYVLNAADIRSHYIFIILTSLAAIVGTLLFKVSGHRKYLAQLVPIHLVIALMFMAFLFRGMPDLEQYDRTGYKYSFACILLSAVLCIIISCIGCRDSLKNSKQMFINWIRENRYVLILAGACAVLALLQFGDEPRWDSAVICKTLEEKSIASIFNLTGNICCGHVSMAYTTILIGFASIVGNMKLATEIVSFTLYIISIFCFYGLIRIIVPAKNNIIYLVATALYAFSPYLLGLCGYIQYDYWLYVLPAIFIYCAYRGLWVWHFAFAIMFCFSKEPAIAVYFGWAFTYAIIELIRLIKLKDKDGFFRLIMKGMGMLTVGLTWFWLYTYYGHWSMPIGNVAAAAETENAALSMAGVAGTEEIALSMAAAAVTENAAWNLSAIVNSQLFKTLCMYYVRNFSWIFSIFSVVCIVLICLKKKNNLWKYILPVLAGQILFSIICGTYNTVNNPRYVDSTPFVLALFTAIFLLEFCSKTVGKVTGIALAAVLLVGNYCDIDPVSIAMYGHITDNIGDEIVLSRQYSGLEKALTKGVKQAVASDELVCFPYLDGVARMFDGIYSCDIDEYDQYWDTKKERRVYYDPEKMFRIWSPYNSSKPDEYVTFAYANVDTDTDFEQLIHGGEASYFYMDGRGDDIADIISSTRNIISTADYKCLGWTVHRIEFR